MTRWLPVALQECIVRIEDHVRSTHPDSDTARARGFAATCTETGSSCWTTADNIVEYTEIIIGLTGIELCLPVSSGVFTSRCSRSAYGREGGGARHQDRPEGMTLGVPVGTDTFIWEDLQKRIGSLLRALGYFTTHGQWALLRMCVNQRLVYLQRMLGL